MLFINAFCEHKLIKRYDMYYCNDLLSLSVLSLYEGELIGKVDKLYLDKKMKKLASLELIGENDTRYLLPTKNIYHIGKNAITVKNNQAVSLKVEQQPMLTAPLGAKAYSIKGSFLGIVKELSINDNFVSVKFSLDNNSVLDVSELASCGKNTIIFYEKDERVNVARFKIKNSPKVFKSEIKQQAKILPTEIQQKEMAITTPPVEQINTSKLVEIKQTAKNPDFLIGRICTKDIFNFNNELLVKSHAVITSKHLKEINKFGKVRELMLYSR